VLASYGQSVLAAALFLPEFGMAALAAQDLFDR
jgi:hypothetical protein